MSKAEERALEAFSFKDANHIYDEELVKEAREYFIEGYHQAEKDLELTWEDVRRIYLIVNSTINDVGIYNLTDKSIYQEVLRRFKALKEENNYYG